jgi:hypothetical protein
MEPEEEKCEGSDPFKDFKIENWKILDDINERQLCTICNKSRKYFCYNCYIPVQSLQGYVPKVKVRFVLFRANFIVEMYDLVLQ